MSSRHLHTHLKSRLTDVSHMLILTKEELARNYLNHGLIQDVTAEKLIAGALEETFVEFVSFISHFIKNSSYQLNMQ